MEPVPKTHVDSAFGLVEALSVGKGDVVSLVGAGGKSTVLYAISLELRRRGLSVVATATTHLQMPAAGTTAPPLVVASEEENWLKTVERRLARYGSVTVVQDRVREDKLRGVEPVMIDPLRGLADCVVVEADGARGRSLKAPADHEPVIPDETTLTVVLVGLDVLGQPLDESHVHRLRVVRTLSRAGEGGIVDDAVVVAAVVGGYLPKFPEHGRRLVFLNKASEDRLKDAERIGEELLRRGAPEVVFGEAAKPGACFYRLRRARATR